MEDLSVFHIQFPYALLGTLEKHFYDVFIVYHFIAALSSPIYYGFRGGYYIKSKTISKIISYAASVSVCRLSLLYGCFSRSLEKLSPANAISTVSPITM